MPAAIVPYRVGDVFGSRPPPGAVHPALSVSLERALLVTDSPPDLGVDLIAVMTVCIAVSPVKIVLTTLFSTKSP